MIRIAIQARCANLKDHRQKTDRQRDDATEKWVEISGMLFHQILKNKKYFKSLTPAEIPVSL